ncbi:MULTISPECIES: FAD-binding oxidoreductase [unclassified Micromonospora]|uniref:FAD-binding oxidoreductase n=1 Tax=unclassified Micromonospora TaxID=2617518 RepID=UPI003627DD11
MAVKTTELRAGPTVRVAETIRAVSADLGPSWAATAAAVDRAAANFLDTVGDRLPGLLPERDHDVIFAALGRLAGGADDTAGRAAALAVLARAHRGVGLLPQHADLLGDALLAAVARENRAHWTAALAAGWERGLRRAVTAVRRAAARVGDGPAWWRAEVVAHDRAADGVAVLTVRPSRPLPHRPGQAVPVCHPHRPGAWRWYSPANAPRPDGTVELHVRAVTAGTVSGTLVDGVRPGEPLLLGPPCGNSLLLDPSPWHDLLLVAGGTGLAPLRALVEQLAAAPDGRRVTLVAGARTPADLYDRATLAELEAAHGWLTVVPAYSHDPAAGSAERGDALTVALRHHTAEQEVHLCGPPPMVAGARLRLLAAGVPADRIHLPDTFDR